MENLKNPEGGPESARARAQERERSVAVIRALSLSSKEVACTTFLQIAKCQVKVKCTLCSSMLQSIFAINILTSIGPAAISKQPMAPIYLSTISAKNDEINFGHFLPTLTATRGGWGGNESE